MTALEIHDEAHGIGIAITQVADDRPPKVGDVDEEGWRVEAVGEERAVLLALERWCLARRKGA